MKKGYIFLAFIVCIWSSLSENVYYVGKDGTVLNLGKSESTHAVKERNMLENGGKFYINGKENAAEGEKYKAAVMSSTMYILKEKISDEVWTSEPEGSYAVRTYDTDNPYVILKNLKIFSGLDENIIPGKYSGYLILKNEKMYHTDSPDSFSEEERVNIGNIDTVSIKQIGNNYFKDKNGIYSYVYEYFSAQSKFLKIKGADEKTFQVLDENYARDRKNIYYKNKTLKIKDTEGFRLLKLWNPEPEVFVIGYSKDGIYYKGKKISSTALQGKAEVIGKTIFKDENQTYIFREYEPEIKIEKRNIPVNAKYTEWILDDESYYYDPYLDVKTAKSEDFEWLDNGNLFRNGKKIYLISPIYGITEQKYDSDTFRLIYNDRYNNKIASDKNGYYLYSGDTTGWQFREIKNEKIKLLDSTENISGNLFYNSAVKKYYFISDLYNGEVTELTGIKNVSGVLLDSYIIGE